MCPDRDKGRGSLIVTFDVDWAPDEVLADTLQLLFDHGVPATLFATHRTSVLEGLGGDVEIGIHPNFNPLLAGAGGTVEAIIDELLEIFPAAAGMRSHSLVQAPVILEHFARRGGQYESNLLIPGLAPFYDFGGLLRMPYGWADNVHMLESGRFERSAIVPITGATFVASFHPTHVFLDCEAPERYAAARGDLQDAERLSAHRNEGPTPGARRVLIELLEWAAAGSVKVETLGAAARRAIEHLGPCPYRHPDEMKDSPTETKPA